MTKNALILIDIQNDYFPDFEGSKMPLPGMNPAADNAALLLKAARRDGTPIFHIRHISGSTAAPFFHPGTEGSETHRKVTPIAGEPVVIKNRPSSFVGTNLDDLLRTAQIDHLIICGAMSQMCVDATTRAAVDMGFKATVVEDACAAANVTFNGRGVAADQVHASIMAPLAAAYAQVVRTADHLKGG